MNRMNNIAGTILLLMLLVLLQCSPQVAGAGSETTNGITGCIRHGNATPAADAVVKVFPCDYDPVISGGNGTFTDTTDSAGIFRISKIPGGRYTVLARDADATEYLLVSDITVSDDSTTPVPTVPLCLPGFIATGFSSGTIVDSGTYLYIPGTDIFSYIGSDGRGLLDHVPAGMLTAVVLATPGNEKRNVLRQSVLVVSGDTVIVRKPEWRFSRELFFNTTVDGAGVTADLYDFPALIRLTSDNFDFPQAAIDGSDLLFSNSDGSLLPFEIERWDQANRLAEVWVHIDTLHGNSSNQSITMYWGAGNSGPRKSNGTAVFDTTDGFSGVWHLGDPAQDTIRDASNNHLHGISPDTARPSIAPGIVGNCRDFNGVSSFITVPNSASGVLDFKQNDRFTLSAWVYVDIFDSHSHVIASKGNLQYFLWHSPIHLNSTLWEFADFRSESGWDLSVAPVSSGVWVLLTGVRDSAVQRLYVNGQPVDTLIDYPFLSERNSSTDFMIGRFAQIMASPNNDEGYCFFKGKIDELRIRSLAENDDWIRMCYMNQRSDNRLVFFK
jgi:hypothetical protein